MKPEGGPPPGGNPGGKPPGAPGKPAGGNPPPNPGGGAITSLVKVSNSKAWRRSAYEHHGQGRQENREHRGSLGKLGEGRRRQYQQQGRQGRWEQRRRGQPVLRHQVPLRAQRQHWDRQSCPNERLGQPAAAIRRKGIQCGRLERSSDPVSASPPARWSARQMMMRRGRRACFASF